MSPSQIRLAQDGAPSAPSDRVASAPILFPERPSYNGSPDRRRGGERRRSILGPTLRSFPERARKDSPHPLLQKGDQFPVLSLSLHGDPEIRLAESAEVAAAPNQHLFLDQRPLQRLNTSTIGPPDQKKICFRRDRLQALNST